MSTPAPTNDSPTNDPPTNDPPTNDLPTNDLPTNDLNEVDADTRAQIRERLQWSPAQRLAYLKDMIAFERRPQTPAA